MGVTRMNQPAIQHQEQHEEDMDMRGASLESHKAAIEKRTERELDKMMVEGRMNVDHIVEAFQEIVYPSSTGLDKSLYHSGPASPEYTKAKMNNRLRYDAELYRSLMFAEGEQDDAELGRLIRTKFLAPYFANKREQWRGEAEEKATRWVMGE